MAKWNFNCKYDPSYCQAIVDFMAEGESLTQFAASIGTHVETLRNWAKANLEFNDAVKTAQGLAEAWWEKTCKRATLGYPSYQFQGQDGKERRVHYSDKLLMFTMKSRFRNYKDVLTVEVTDESYSAPSSLIPDQDDPSHNATSALN